MAEEAITVKIKCRDCDGTGVYCGSYEPKGTGVRCGTCKGAGGHDFTYTLFTERKLRTGKWAVATVLIWNQDASDRVPVTYEEFLALPVG